jgi:hypothetical protein
MTICPGCIAIEPKRWAIGNIPSSPNKLLPGVNAIRQPLKVSPSTKDEKGSGGKKFETY